MQSQRIGRAKQHKSWGAVQPKGLNRMLPNLANVTYSWERWRRFWKYQRDNKNSLIQRRTGNTMAKWKSAKEQIKIYKTLHRKLKIKQHEPEYKQGMNYVRISSSCSTSGTHRVTLVTNLVNLSFNNINILSII